MRLLARRQQNRLFFRPIGLCLAFYFFSQILYASSFYDKLSSLFSFNMPLNILELVNKNIPGKMSAKSIEYILPNKIKIQDLEVIKDEKEVVLAAKYVEL